MSISKAEDDIKNRSVQIGEKISTYLINIMFNKFHAFKLMGGEMNESTFMTYILKHIRHLQNPHIYCLTGLLTKWLIIPVRQLDFDQLKIEVLTMEEHFGNFNTSVTPLPSPAMSTTTMNLKNFHQYKYMFTYLLAFVK